VHTHTRLSGARDPIRVTWLYDLDIYLPWISYAADCELFAQRKIYFSYTCIGTFESPCREAHSFIMHYFMHIFSCLYSVFFSALIFRTYFLRLPSYPVAFLFSTNHTRLAMLLMVWRRWKNILMLNPCRKPPPNHVSFHSFLFRYFSRPHFFLCSFNLLKY
jgi:hypothetical protein